MSKANIITKLHIAQMFRSLVDEKDYDDVSITDIVNAGEIGRRTFYYHFCDKQDLVAFIFRYDMAKVIKKAFIDKYWVSDTELKNEKYRNYPFYLDMRNPQDDLSLGHFWTALYMYFEKEQDYYHQIFRSEEQNNLRHYLYDIYTVQLKKDAVYCIGDREYPDDFLDFIVDYFYNSCLGWIISNLITGSFKHYRFASEIMPMKNLSHHLLKYSINQYFELTKQ